MRLNLRAYQIMLMVMRSGVQLKWRGLQPVWLRVVGAGHKYIRPAAAWGLARHVIGLIRRLDVRKPLHAVIVGVLLAGIVAPVADYIATNVRYNVGQSAQAVAERPSPRLMDKLRYNEAKKASIFNAEGQADTEVPKDKLQASVGAGGKKDKQLYTATMPDDPTKGIVVQDNVNDVAVTFRPQVALMGGRSKGGRVVYPLKDQAGQMMFTPKANGLKEDIVLTRAPATDAVAFDYQLDYPDSVVTRLADDGSVGFYTASPELFGDISYGTDNDRSLVEKARANGAKTYLMFSIPAPTIRETGKSSAVTARFELNGKHLVVRTTGLQKAHYPLSIDPTFLLTSTTDFVLGSIDDNIDLSVAGQVGRQTLVGGSASGWSALAAPNLTYAQFATSLVAYNGFLYMIGGGSGNGTSGTTTNDVRYICLNPNTGALGTNGGCTPTAWTTTSSLITARQGLIAYGFNGYLYAVGGEGNTGVPLTAANSVEYAQITSTGALAANSGCGTGWCHGSNLNTVRSYPAGAIYQGVLYVMGGTSGTNNATPVATTEYARINGDGTVASWTVSTSLATGSLTSARSKFKGGAYNGYLYVAGGQTSTTTVINTVEYASIQTDGSIGAWVATTAFPTARRDHGMVINNGYMYVFGGCTGAAQACAGFIADTQYAVINADGSLGQWQTCLNYNSGTNDAVADYNSRMPGGIAAYSNHLYFVGGCSAETATNNCATQLVGTFITDLDPVGRYDRGIQTIQTTKPYENNAAVSARFSNQTAVLNGYIYNISGETTTGGVTYNATTEVAAINANGSLGTWSATGGNITAQSGNNPGRIGFTVASYKDKIYVIGGIERSTVGNVDVFTNTVMTATQDTSTGAITGWAAETNTIPSTVGYHTTVMWHNWLYVVGGRNGAGAPFNTIYKSQIQANGTLGTWAATTTGLSQARWAHSGGIWGNWLYVIGGETTLAGTYVGTTAGNNAVEKLTITNTGDITSASTGYAFPVSQRHANGFVYNGYLYAFGGITSASTAARANIYYAALNATTGAPGTFDNTNIGNIFSGTAGLATARHQLGATLYNGVFYVTGGCTSTQALGTATYDACTTLASAANSTEESLPNNGGTGQTGTFTTGSSNAIDLPTVGGTAGRADHSTVAFNGKIYVVGGCNAYTAGACTGQLGDIRSADIGADGTLTGSWTAQTSLPGGEVRSGVRAVAYNGYMYVVGGQSAGAGATPSVWYTTIDNTGALGGTWNNASNALGNDLPVNRRDFGMAIMNGFMYVVGGEDAAGAQQNTVYYASVDNSNGAIGSWATTTAFTTARAAFGFAAYNGVLYIAGGFDGTNTLTDVQYGVIGSAGTISAWNYTTDLGRGARARQAVGSNGYMYFFGDEGSTLSVSYANINANGTLGPLQRSVATMNGAHAHGSVAAADGMFYETGGCALASNVCSTVTAASDRSGQQAISRVGHYSKLYNTQVDTSPTQLVINGATNGPGSAVEFKLQTASSSDPALGVAQLIRPVIFNNFYTVQALNSSGTNVGVALNYLFLITLDDSRSGTFPDVANTASGSFSQTAVTDISLYYHANPGRRLRHGASFTDTGCNPTPAEGCLLDTAP